MAETSRGGVPEEGGAPAPLELEEPLAGRFEALRILGQGAAGRVILARDRHLERLVAVKVFQPLWGLGEDLRRRFRLEAVAAAGLHHPHIVTVYDSGVDARGAPYILYQYVPGRDLRARLTEPEPVPVEQVLEWGEQLADALHCMHERGLVHRDMKPANVLLRDDGWIFLADLGLVQDEAGAGGLTATGALVGTPLYMAPELWYSPHATPASDQFALAVTLHQLVCRRVVYQGRTLEEMAAMVRGSEELPLADEVRARAPALADVLAVALRRQPAARFPSLRGLAEELRELRRATRSESAAGVGPRGAGTKTMVGRVCGPGTDAPRSPPVGRGAALLRLASVALVAAALAAGGQVVAGRARREGPPPAPPLGPTPVADDRDDEVAGRLVRVARRLRAGCDWSGARGDDFAAFAAANRAWMLEEQTLGTWLRLASNLEEWLDVARRARAEGHPLGAVRRREVLGEVLGGPGSIQHLLQNYHRLQSQAARQGLPWSLEGQAGRAGDARETMARCERVREPMAELLDRIRGRVADPPDATDLVVLGLVGEAIDWGGAAWLLPRLGDHVVRHGHQDLPELMALAEEGVCTDGNLWHFIPCEVRRTYLERMLEGLEAGTTPAESGLGFGMRLRAVFFASRFMVRIECREAGDLARLTRLVDLALEEAARGRPPGLDADGCRSWFYRTRPALDRARGSGPPGVSAELERLDQGLRGYCGERPGGA